MLSKKAARRTPYDFPSLQHITEKIALVSRCSSDLSADEVWLPPKRNQLFSPLAYISKPNAHGIHPSEFLAAQGCRWFVTNRCSLVIRFCYLPWRKQQNLTSKLLSPEELDLPKWPVRSPWGSYPLLGFWPLRHSPFSPLCLKSISPFGLLNS